jgi:hypothetical protein
VISITAPGGESQSFFVAQADAARHRRSAAPQAVWVDRQEQ